MASLVKDGKEGKGKKGKKGKGGGGENLEVEELCEKMTVLNVVESNPEVNTQIPGNANHL